MFDKRILRAAVASLVVLLLPWSCGGKKGDTPPKTLSKKHTKAEGMVAVRYSAKLSGVLTWDKNDENNLEKALSLTRANIKKKFEFTPEPKIKITLDNITPFGASPFVELYFEFGDEDEITVKYNRQPDGVNVKFDSDLQVQQVDQVPTEAKNRRDPLIVVDIAQAPDVRPVQTIALGQAVRVRNTSDVVGLRVATLQVALSSTTVSYSQFAYSDPAVEALPWQTVIATTTDFAPAEEMDFDVPDSPIPPFAPSHVYVRALYTDPATGAPMDSVLSFRPAESEQPPDHRVCYKGKSKQSALPVVTVADRFETADFQPKPWSSTAFCTPAAPEDSTITDSATHLEHYKLKRVADTTEISRVMSVSTLFHTVTLEARKAISLFVPTAADYAMAPSAPDPDLPGYGAFLCRKVRTVGAYHPPTPTVLDEHGTHTLPLKRPKYLCTTASTDGSPAPTSTDDLLCYSVRGAATPTTPVFLNNEFGAHQATLGAESLYCAPAYSELLP